MNWRYFIPFFDSSTSSWSMEARLLRWLTFLWMCVGLVVMFSASYPIANLEHGDGLYYFKRQLIWVLIGMVGFNLIVQTSIQSILRTARLGLFLVLGLLGLTLIPGVGTTINGATRWIAIGPALLQPSELMKPFLILQSSCFFAQWNRLSWNVRFRWLGIFLAILLMILIQPNLSTTALCGMTLWLIALAAGLPFTYLGGTALGGVLLATLSISFREYQKRRVLSFLNPWADPMNDGYQLIQSLLAVGSGGLWGTGLGLSQQKVFYLPIQYSDFIFAVYAEEFGLIGGLMLLFVLAIFATISLRVALRSRRIEHQLIAIGVMVVMVGQSILNIGVATGVLPTTGLPLPLFSYGGSSMVASLALAALIIRVARESNEAEVVSLKPNPVRRTRQRSR